MRICLFEGLRKLTPSRIEIESTLLTMKAAYKECLELYLSSRAPQYYKVIFETDGILIKNRRMCLVGLHKHLEYILINQIKKVQKNKELKN